MANETLIARLEQSLRQSRAARSRLAARLAELESESEIIRAELAEMDTLAGQTEAAIFRLLSNVLSGPSTQVGTTSVGELEAELQYFNEHRAEFMEKAAGKFALIKGDRLIGMFDNETSAIRNGYQKLGNVPFLVKQVTEVDIPLTFTSFNLGV